MRLLLVFLLATFLVAVWAANRGRPSRAWVLAIVSLGVAILFFSPRAL